MVVAVASSCGSVKCLRYLKGLGSREHDAQQRFHTDVTKCVVRFDA